MSSIGTGVLLLICFILLSDFPRYFPFLVLCILWSIFTIAFKAIFLNPDLIMSFLSWEFFSGCSLIHGTYFSITHSDISEIVSVWDAVTGKQPLPSRSLKSRPGSHSLILTSYWNKFIPSYTRICNTKCVSHDWMKTDFYFKKIQSVSGVGKLNSLFQYHVLSGVDKCTGC